MQKALDFRQKLNKLWGFKRNFMGEELYLQKYFYCSIRSKNKVKKRVEKNRRKGKTAHLLASLVIQFNILYNN